MTSEEFLEKLSPDQKDLSLRIFNLVLGKVLREAYSGFDEETKKEMEKVFDSENDGEKDGFLKKNIPDFKKRFEEEMKKTEDGIKAEIEKRI
jgi:hypothetical protein